MPPAQSPASKKKALSKKTSTDYRDNQRKMDPEFDKKEAEKAKARRAENKRKREEAAAARAAADAETLAAAETLAGATAGAQQQQAAAAAGAQQQQQQQAPARISVMRSSARMMSRICACGNPRY
eukprot:4626834-Prymnesium_polylepis.1